MQKRFCLIGLLLLSLSVQAGTGIDNVGLFDNILRRFSDTASMWSSAMVDYASWLFWGLALISMTWTFGMMVLRKADFQEFFAEAIKFFTVTGIFWWMLKNGPALSTAIIDSLREIAAKATGLGNTLSPSGIVDIGFDIVSKVVDQTSVWAPINSGIGLIVAAVILCLFATIAINMLLLLVSGWLLAYGGVFLLGFGGGRWTTDIAISYYKTVLGVGVQIFTMILIIGVGRSFIDQYYAAMSQNVAIKELFVLLVAALILFLLVNKIPPLLGGIVGGSNFASGIGNFGAGAAMGAAGMAAAAAATGSGSMLSGASHAVGGASALKAAFQAAQQNMSSGSGSGGSGSGLATAGRFAADMGASLAKGAGHMVKDKASSLTAAAKERVGQTVGGKLAAAIRNNSGASASQNGDANAAQGEQGAEATPLSSFGGDSVGAGKGAESEAEKMGAFVEDALTEQDALDSSASDEVASFVNQEGK